MLFSSFFLLYQQSSRESHIEKLYTINAIYVLAFSLKSFCQDLIIKVGGFLLHTEINFN